MIPVTNLIVQMGIGVSIHQSLRQQSDYTVEIP